MNKLFVLSGQSGVGKTSIAQKIIGVCNIAKVITCTTRKPREYEKDRIDYFFLTEEEFRKKINQNYFLEYAQVHSWFYGTPREQVDDILENNKNVLMVIDVQGAINVKKLRPEAVLIFLKFDDQDLEKNIRNRISNDKSRDFSKTEILKRIESAKKETGYIKFYDYSVINPEGHPEQAIKEIKKIIIKETNV